MILIHMAALLVRVIDFTLSNELNFSYFIDSTKFIFLLSKPMVSLSAMYHKLSTSKQIGLVVSINFFIVMFAIIVTLMLVLDRVSISKKQTPEQFFQAYDEYSLKETSKLVKQLILSIIDYRTSFMIAVANSLKSSQIASMNVVDTRQQTWSKLQKFKVTCLLSQPTASIFSCTQDPYSKFILESGWISQNQRAARRFNIVYQNSANINDIMVKTISDQPNFTINISKITTKMSKLKQGFVSFSSFYLDQYSNFTQSLISFDTRLTFQNYKVFLEMQTFGTQITRPLTRVLFKDNMNVIVLAVNNKSSTSYDQVASLKPLDPSINYTMLLQTGYSSHASACINAYSIAISSLYSLGSTISASDPQINDDYVLIVHAESATATLKQIFVNFINNIISTEHSVLFIFLSVLLVSLAVILAQSVREIGRNIKICNLALRAYFTSLENYNQLVSHKNDQVYGYLRSNSLLRVVDCIVKMIQTRKKNFKKRSSINCRDEFPLNMMDKTFQERSGWSDYQTLQRIYNQLKSIKHLWVT